MTKPEDANSKIQSGDLAVLQELLDRGFGDPIGSSAESLESLQEAIAAEASACQAGKPWPAKIHPLFRGKGPHTALNILRFVDLLFDRMRDGSELHADINRELDKLRLSVASCALISLQTLVDIKAPFRQFIQLVFEAGKGWYAGVGRLGNAFSDPFNESIELICKSPSPAMAFMKACAKLEAANKGILERSSKLELRLQSGEAGQIKAQLARRRAATQINRTLGSLQIAKRAHEFILGPWKNSLQLTMIKHGEDSDAWRRMVRLTDTLADTLQPIETNEQRQQAFKAIPVLNEELHDALLSEQHNEQSDAIAEIDDLLVQLLTQAEIEYKTLPKIPLFESASGVTMSISHSLKAEARMQTLGKWYVYQEKDMDTAIRCKLALISEEAEMQVFVNMLGVKCLQQSLDEFAFALSTGAMQPLHPVSNLDASIARIIYTLNKRVMELDRRQAELEERRQQQRERLEQARAAAKAKAEAEALALEQAKAEVKRLQAEHKRQKEQAAQAAIEADADALISTFSAGDWILLKQEDEEVEAKLAVKMKSSGKYIFVDRIGIKLAELQHEDMIQMLIRGELRPLDAADIENSLSRVLGSMRGGK